MAEIGTNEARQEWLTDLLESANRLRPQRQLAGQIVKLTAKLREVVDDGAWLLVLRIDEQVNARHARVLEVVARRAFRAGFKAGKIAKAAAATSRGRS